MGEASNWCRHGSLRRFLTGKTHSSDRFSRNPDDRPFRNLRRICREFAENLQRIAENLQRICRDLQRICRGFSANFQVHILPPRCVFQILPTFSQEVTWAKGDPSSQGWGEPHGWWSVLQVDRFRDARQRLQGAAAPARAAENSCILQ